MNEQPFPQGRVQWAGENPGMYLKERAEGPFVALASFFRVVASPYGAGVGAVVMEAPESAVSRPDTLNVCVGDNEPLMRYLVKEYLSFFGAFKGQPGLQGLEYRRLTGSSSRNEMPHRYLEELRGEGLEIKLTWSEIGQPFLVDLPPAKSATGKHRMISLFADVPKAEAVINGRRLRGQSQPRDFQGRPGTTAFMAFAETWLLPK
ncbi:MAG: hypothetical protein OEW39_10550 [Deltaproteobacteria bacterium]|nr:hypothetical protein [Deltaproteobacteria bacterium]